MNFTEREIKIIVSALYILEGQAYGDEFHPDIKSVFFNSSLPNGDEIRTLMNRLEDNQKIQESERS